MPVDTGNVWNGVVNIVSFLTMRTRPLFCSSTKRRPSGDTSIMYGDQNCGCRASCVST